jgi:hypothetical protein
MFAAFLWTERYSMLTIGEYTFILEPVDPQLIRDFHHSRIRISLVLGYMPSEVIGKSAYKFILVSDHVISLFAHKLSKSFLFLLLRIPSYRMHSCSTSVEGQLK